jgi:hypothetical protein
VADLKKASDFAFALSPASFWLPEYFCPSGWIEHAPFAFWVCEALHPRHFIELGTHYGYSYFAFCQAIDRLGLGTTAYAVDSWQGDEHAGFYDESVFQSVAARNNEKYSGFSTLIRSTFEGALDYFTDGSIDLLHIDGRHFYDDVKHDFVIWRPKLAENGVVLFHDTNVREREFGVWKFFDELSAQHPSFRFFHGHGLGLLVLGEPVPATIAPLIHAPRETADQIRAVYAFLGGALSTRAALGGRDREIAALRTALAQRDEELAEALGAIEAQNRLIAAAAGPRSPMAIHQSSGMQRSAPTEHCTAPGDALRRADELLATLQSAQCELSKSWLGRQILQAGRVRLQNRDGQQT